MKYRKKPIVIEAFRIGIDNIPDWFMDKVSANDAILHKVPFSESRPLNYGQTYCDIVTMEGTMRGDYGDFIIKGVNNEIYPCKPDIFEKTYQAEEERVRCPHCETMRPLDGQTSDGRQINGVKGNAELTIQWDVVRDYTVKLDHVDGTNDMFVFEHCPKCGRPLDDSMVDDSDQR